MFPIYVLRSILSDRFNIIIKRSFFLKSHASIIMKWLLKMYLPQHFIITEEFSLILLRSIPTHQTSLPYYSMTTNHFKYLNKCLFAYKYTVQQMNIYGNKWRITGE